MLSTFSAQSDVSGVKSKGFSKIKKIRLFRQGISENLGWLSRKIDYSE